MDVLSLERLDKTQTYCFGLWQDTEPSRLAQRWQESDIMEGERWTHCGILFYEAGWQVLEAVPEVGVRMVEWPRNLEAFARVAHVQAFPLPLDVAQARQWVGSPFPKREMLRALRHFERTGERDLRGCAQGVTCAALLSGAQSDFRPDMLPAAFQQQGLDKPWIDLIRKG